MKPKPKSRDRILIGLSKLRDAGFAWADKHAISRVSRCATTTAKIELNRLVKEGLVERRPGRPSAKGHFRLTPET